MMPSTAPLCLAPLLRLAFILLLLSVSVSTAESEWRRTAFLTDGNSTVRGHFGLSVAIDDGIVVVGAPHKNNMAANLAGAASIYSSVDGEWSKEVTIIASDAAFWYLYGSSVAVSNGIVVVGAPGNDNAGGRDAGAVYVYVREEDGSWTEQAKLVASDGHGYDYFGRAISVHGSTVIAGTPYDDDQRSGSGSVYAFMHKDGTWTEQAKLTPSDGSAADHFGYSVSVHGTWMVIGSPGDDIGGSAYLFEQMADGTWTQQAKLVASDGEGGHDFGSSVDILGNVVAVGAPDARIDDFSGAAYLFKMVSGAWTEQAKLVSSVAAGVDQFGYSLSVAEEGLVVGAPSLGDLGYSSFFAYDGATWTEQARFTANGTNSDNWFGFDVAFDQGTAVIGSPGYSTRKGAVYTYEASPLTPEPSGFPTLPPTKANPDCERVVIDFEEYAVGDRPFNLGYGVRVRGDGNRARHGVMIFDTANPTGEDEDLASEDLGKILILSEDGDATDPDDNMLGGYIRFTFKPPISEVISVDLKDFDTQGSSITGKYADSSVFTTISIDPSEGGGEQTVMIGESNVGRLKINLAGSGGIDNLTLIYCEP